MPRRAAGDSGRPTEAALVLKLGPNPFHHGTLGIIRGLGRVGVPVFAVMEDIGSPAGWSRYLCGDFLWNPDVQDTDTVLRDLRDIGRSIGGRPVLIPVDDVGAILAAEHADVLEPCFRLPRQPRELPRRLASKELLAELCEELGLATPTAHVFRSLQELCLAEGLTYPLVVKLARPRTQFGRGRLGSTTVVVGPDQLSDLVARFPADADVAVMVQEYLPAGSCEDWFFHGCVGEAADGSPAFRLSFTGRKLRSFPPTAGLTSLGCARDNPELREIAEGFLVAVGYRGIVDLDFRLDRRTNSYHLLDANPRPGAQFAMARRSDGADAAQALYRELTGHPMPPQRGQSDDHAFCVENYDLLSAGWLFLHGRLTPSAWLRPLRAEPVDWAWFAVDDLVPCLLMWLRYVLHLATRSRRPGRRRHPHPVRRNRFPLLRRGPGDRAGACPTKQIVGVHA